MKKISVLGLLTLLALAQAAGQSASDNRGQPSDGPQSGGASSAAADQATGPGQISENPPLTGLDMPGLGPRVTPQSFLIPGLQVSESLDSNIGLEEGNTSVHSATQVLGSAELQKLWSKYEVGLDYVGGGTFYNSSNFGAQQVHSLLSEGRIFWRTGQLALRNAFAYLPEGSFGFGVYGGGLGSYPVSGPGFGIPGLGFGGQLGFFGGSQFGALGEEARVSNVTVGDFTEYLSARSSVTLAAGYGLVHFVDNPLNLIDSRQVSAQAGYNYSLNSRDTIAVLYGFQSFRFPETIAAGTFQTDLVNVLYGHRISERLDFVAGCGPQITHIKDPIFGNQTHVSGSGRVSLRYRFRKGSAAVGYYHYNTSGSGFVAGAGSDVVEATASAALTRKWEGLADAGYSHNNSLQSSAGGVSAGAYSYGYLGFALRRPLGKQFGFFLSYQFNEQAFALSPCVPGTGGCSQTAGRHIFGVGLDWHGKPIRL